AVQSAPGQPLRARVLGTGQGTGTRRARALASRPVGTRGNEPGTGSVVASGRSCLVCSCHCTLAVSDVAGVLFRDLGKSRREPARAPHRAGPDPAPLKEWHVTGNR